MKAILLRLYIYTSIICLSLLYPVYMVSYKVKELKLQTDKSLINAKKLEKFYNESFIPLSANKASHINEEILNNESAQESESNKTTNSFSLLSRILSPSGNGSEFKVSMLLLGLVATLHYFLKKKQQGPYYPPKELRLDRIILIVMWVLIIFFVVLLNILNIPF